MTTLRTFGLITAVVIGFTVIAGATYVATDLAPASATGPALAAGQSPRPSGAQPLATTATATSAQPAPALEPGDRGPAVIDLQAALEHLGYQPAVEAGVFDDETGHAVIAFQKVHDLPRTGIVDAAAHDALARPTIPTPRSIAPGFHVEVDLTKQVTYFVRDGAVEQILDSSSGQPGSPTPAGEFTITYQIDGWRYAQLGDLYRPSYLGHDGIAFHGGEPVEPEPASHGCVRLTDPTIDRVFDQLRPGTKVLIY